MRFLSRHTGAEGARTEAHGHGGQAEWWTECWAGSHGPRPSFLSDLEQVACPLQDFSL